MTGAAAVMSMALALAACGRAGADPAPAGASPPLSAPSAAVGGVAAVARFHVKGIACSSCADSIRAELRKMAGVVAVEVDLAKKDVIVQHDSQRVSPEAIKKEIVRLGFEVG